MSIETARGFFLCRSLQTLSVVATTTPIDRTYPPAPPIRPLPSSRRENTSIGRRESTSNDDSDGRESATVLDAKVRLRR